MKQEVILSIRDLNVKFSMRGQVLHALRGISIDLYKGESLAIVGESGSGKSVLVKNLNGLLDKNGWVDSGSILYNGMDLATFRNDDDWTKIRGKEIAMVMQDPMTSLNPLKTVGWQIEEALRLHQSLSGEAAKSRAIEILSDVGIPDAQRRYKQYPHEFSGGMRQRVLIAMALCCKPKLLIADEPTTALDVTIQAQILELLKQLRDEEGMSIVLITHDLGVVASLSNRISVMYGGLIMEEGLTDEIFYTPRHPYTKALLHAIPQPVSGSRGRLEAIPGMAPSLIDPPTGCPFAERCKYACDACRETLPAYRQYTPTQRAMCIFTSEELAQKDQETKQKSVAGGQKKGR